MTRQRFCPICDRAFTDGEAVLRCRECSLLHHPTCWVRNEGCSAGCESADMPEPIAYDLPAAQGPGIRPPRPVSGIPAASRGGRVEGPRDPVERVIPVDRTEDDEQYDDEDDEESEQRSGVGRWIGRSRPNAGGSGAAAPIVVEPARRAKGGRYAADERRTPPVEDMRLYRRRGVLRYWYVPMAAILAIGVAIGVVWAADQFIGGDSAPAANGEPEPTPGDDENGQPQPTPTPEGTPTPEPTPTLAPGQIGPGVSGVVSGLGTGGFLNVRVGPGTENDIIISVPDGTPFTVVGGPQQSGNFTWWEIETQGVVGWAAQDWLTAEGATEEGTTEDGTAE